MGGVVATSEIAAARAGAGALAAGGNAVDAAICAAACLTVTEPTSNGLGGDLFALVWDGGRVHALASSGAAPAALDPDAVPGDRVPLRGWIPVTVPGQVAGWEALAGLGRLGLDRLLAPAVRLAREGFPVGPVTAAAWARAAPLYREFPEWCRVFLPGGTPPAAGQRFRNPDLAGSLEAIARDGAIAFYRDLGARIAEHARATGGFLAEADLLAHRARWEAPLEVTYAGLRVLGAGPPTQGVVTLEALAVLDGLGPVGAHEQIEAVKLAFADAYATVADPAAPGAVPATDLLHPAFVSRRRAAVDRARAGPSPAPPAVGLGGTVLVCTGDDEGRVCSLIQSNFHGFGSGIVVPGTGIALQNRGAGFVTTPGHPNRITGGKRPFHTILPGLFVGPGAVGAFGCMGGQMQPQGQVQLMVRFAGGASPGGAIDAPRWRWLDDGPVALEVGFDPEVAADLARRGHRIVADVEAAQFGGAQMVVHTADGGLIAGSDRRKDGGVVRSA